MDETGYQYEMSNIQGTANPSYRDIPNGRHVSDVSVDMSGGTQHSRTSSNGMRRRYSSKNDNKDELIARLPSRQLYRFRARAVIGTLGSNTETLARKSKKKKNHSHGTLRLKQGEFIKPDEIADDLLDDVDFGQEPAELQTGEIRNLATNMTNKRAIRNAVRQKQSDYDKHPGLVKGTKFGLSVRRNPVTKAFQRLKKDFDEVSYTLELWRGHLKKIEGNFGTGVTTYFLFLKLLFLLNLPVFLFSFSFVVLPQLLYRYIVLNGYHGNYSFTGVEILTGVGWFQQTELYYGAYYNGSVALVENSSHDYFMQYTYLLTAAANFLLILIIILVSLSRSYKRNFVGDKGDFKFYYVTKVFCGWDFNVTQEKSAELKHKTIFKEFQEYLSAFQTEKKLQTCSEYCNLIALRMFTNTIILGLLVGAGYLVWYISETQSLANDVEFFSEMALPLVLSGINFILPFGFTIIASFERYAKPQTELYMTMLRTIILNVVTLGVLVYFWFTTIDCSKYDESSVEWLDREHECKPCWENFVGQEIYRLIIVDFIFILVITFLTEFVRKLMAQFCCKSLNKPEFNIGRNTLALIYSQTVVWIGSFYSPLLVFINVIKIVVIFYVKRFSVMQNCQPSSKAWRGGRTHTVILGLLFVAFLLSFTANGYGVVFMKPSETCGPYIGLNSSYDVITDAINDWRDNNANANRALTIVVEIITSAAFLVGLLIVLCVIAHYARVVANGHQEMINLLKCQIKLEGKDKQFLLKLLQQATKKSLPPKQAEIIRLANSQVNSSPGSVASRSTRHTNVTDYQSRTETPNGHRSGTPGSGTPHSHSQYTDDNRSTYMSPSEISNPNFTDTSPVNTPHLPYGDKHYMNPERESKGKKKKHR